MSGCMHHSAVQTTCLTWKEVTRMNSNELQAYLQLPHPEGPGLTSDFVQAYFKTGGGDVLAALQGEKDLQERGMSEDDANYFWSFLTFFKVGLYSTKRPRIDGVVKFVDTWSSNWCGSRHVHLCPQHVARTARLACAGSRGSRTAFGLFCIKTPRARRRQQTRKSFGRLSWRHGAV